VVGDESWVDVNILSPFLSFAKGLFEYLLVTGDGRARWSKDIRYLAVKILTAGATRGHQRNELEYLEAIRD
jgi:hypothetical protein